MKSFELSGDKGIGQSLWPMVHLANQFFLMTMISLQYSSFYEDITGNEATHPFILLSICELSRRSLRVIETGIEYSLGGLANIYNQYCFKRKNENYFLLGEEYLKQQEWTKANICFEKTKTMDVNNEKWFAVSCQFSKHQQFSFAIKTISKILPLTNTTLVEKCQEFLEIEAFEVAQFLLSQYQFSYKNKLPAIQMSNIAVQNDMQWGIAYEEIREIILGKKEKFDPITIAGEKITTQAQLSKWMAELPKETIEAAEVILLRDRISVELLKKKYAGKSAVEFVMTDKQKLIDLVCYGKSSEARAQALDLYSTNISLSIKSWYEQALTLKKQNPARAYCEFALVSKKSLLWGMQYSEAAELVKTMESIMTQGNKQPDAAMIRTFHQLSAQLGIQPNKDLQMRAQHSDDSIRKIANYEILKFTLEQAKNAKEMGTIFYKSFFHRGETMLQLAVEQKEDDQQLNLLDRAYRNFSKIVKEASKEITASAKSTTPLHQLAQNHCKRILQSTYYQTAVNNAQGLTPMNAFVTLCIS
jgi:hypothetical protein